MIPDTTNFMLAGYAVIFSVMAIYIASLLMRWRNLQQDLIILQEMQEKK
ncbi:MAG: hypothetical protein Q7U34_15160 [Anaerolineales bacterium]|nr:hypothetical protein [Anaerolineales bacterium]MDO9348156.1 hypothetical protein [Anaerolineales bacterium]MDP3186435.1 hypothetical protein [Anaerolineales bacterium]